MKNIDTTPYLARAAREIELSRNAGNLFAAEIEDALKRLESGYTNTDDLIEAAQRTMRLLIICKANLAGKEDFRKAYDSTPLPLWKSHEPLEADGELQRGLGDKLFNIADGQKDAHGAVMIGAGSNVIAGRLIERLMEQKIPFNFNVADDDFSHLAFNHMDQGDMESYAAFYNEWNDKITNRMIVLPSSEPPSAVERDEEKDRLFRTLTSVIGKRTGSGQVMMTLTYFPTRIDAEIDGIPYDDYIKLYFELCDQPDHLIGRANDFLINLLNKTSTIRFTNKDGTDVSMSLIHEDGRHFTFANSQTRRNVPGSEVFSAPQIDSINGVIVSKGKFLPVHDEDKQIVNLTRNFENGVLTSFSAEQGAEYFQAFLDRHPGNLRVGELGIGTNPHLKRHVANGLLVEKISSSFHTAHGAAYTMTDYLGTPVLMDNGNRSIDHWDITTMLGDMYLDGVCILKDGVYLPPELDVLNRGWAVVPVAERPERWKNYAGPYTGVKS